MLWTCPLRRDRNSVMSMNACNAASLHSSSQNLLHPLSKSRKCRYASVNSSPPQQIHCIHKPLSLRCVSSQPHHIQSSSNSRTAVLENPVNPLVECLEVQGGYELSGNVQVSGAKNSALAILAGALCSSSELQIQRVPNLVDVHHMVQVLKSIGVTVKRNGDKLLIDAREVTSVEPSSEAVRKLRAGFFIIGALVGRKGEAVLPLPGGCNIGARPIDLHVRGLRALGAAVEIRQGKVYASLLDGRRRLVGGRFHLDYPSVGATETLIMAACLAEGKTVLTNAAQEPEVVDLAEFLISCGAEIQGAGTRTLVITGVRELHGTDYTVIPDRVEAGTFLIAAAVMRSRISMAPVVAQHLEAVVGKLEEMGCEIWQTGSESLMIDCAKLTGRGLKVTTLPYPGFPTDLQPQFMTLLTTCGGQSMLEETVFEGRMRHVEELRKLGAVVRVRQNVAVVDGSSKGSASYGAPVSATDLRAGAALVLAGMAAKGTTIVQGVGHIDRGYEGFDAKLRQLGAHVSRLPCLPAELTL